MRLGAAQPGEGIVALTSGAHGTAIVEPAAPTPDGLVALAGREQHAGRRRSGRHRVARRTGPGRAHDADRAVPPGARDGDVARLGGAPVRYFPTTELEPIVQATTGRLVTVLTGTLTGTSRHVAGSRSTARSATVRSGPTAPTVPTARPRRPELPDRPDRPDRPPVVRPPVPVTDPVVTDAFAAAVATLATRVDAAAPAVTFVGADPVALGGAVLARLAPAISVARRVATMIAAPQPVDPFRGIMAFPILPEATYRYLDELGGGWMLPGADGLEPDTAILLQTNPAFTSAFLVGMNHEMDGELLWRSYPTDQRGTPFQRFWERVDGTVDIDPVHLWPADLPLATAGQPSRFTTSGTGADGQIVLLLRGQLLRRYPEHGRVRRPRHPCRAGDGGGTGRPAGVRRAPAAGPEPRRVRPDTAAAGQRRVVVRARATAHRATLRLRHRRRPAAVSA